MFMIVCKQNFLLSIIKTQPFPSVNHFTPFAEVDFKPFEEAYKTLTEKL